jgi:hypothetical protein
LWHHAESSSTLRTRQPPLGRRTKRGDMRRTRSRIRVRLPPHLPARGPAAAPQPALGTPRADPHGARLAHRAEARRPLPDPHPRLEHDRTSCPSCATSPAIEPLKIIRIERHERMTHPSRFQLLPHRCRVLSDDHERCCPGSPWQVASWSRTLEAQGAQRGRIPLGERASPQTSGSRTPCGASLPRPR